MSERPNSAAARDVAYHLHPYTNARKHEAEGPLIIERGEGIRVFDDQGRAYIEGMSGLWCVSLGFSEKRLVAAATKQLETLPFYHSFNHKTGTPAIDLAEALIKLAPVPMSKVFFANSGSEANDSVVKLVWYARNALGQPERKKIISRIKGYHGVTVASASLTGLPYNHRDFDLPIANILHSSCPHHYRFAEDGESEEDFATRTAAELEAQILEEGPETIAAFIGEPVMGAGGVIVPPATYWEKIQAVLKKYGIWLIADEVICGFGRTGNMFGCETFGIKPDVMVVAKALSSAYLPISAVMVGEELYQAVADNSAKIGVFGHGFTYTGHPVSAAVALETLKIYEERDIVGHVQSVAPHFLARLNRLGDHPLVGEASGVGLVGAVELVADKAGKIPFDPLGSVGPVCAKAAEQEGLIVRAMMDRVAFCPPLIITDSEIDDLFDRFERALDSTWNEVTSKGLASVA